MTFEQFAKHETADGIAYYRNHNANRADAETLVFAHGYGDSAACWDQVLSALNGQYDLIAVDARGHGESAGASAEFSPADDLYEVVRAAGADSVVLIGHSVGAAAALEMADQHPELVTKLVLEDPPWAAPEVSDEALERGKFYMEKMSRIAEMTLEEVIKVAAVVHSEWSAQEYPEWAKAKRALQPDLREYLKLGRDPSLAERIEIPTLVVYGERTLGSMVSDEIVSSLSKKNPAIQGRCLVGAGHNVRREQLEQYLKILNSFLEGNLE